MITINEAYNAAIQEKRYTTVRDFWARVGGKLGVSETTARRLAKPAGLRSPEWERVRLNIGRKNV